MRPRPPALELVSVARAIRLPAALISPHNIRHEHSNRLADAFSEGLVSETDVDAAVSHVLAHKFRNGLFDDRATTPVDGIALVGLNACMLCAL